MKNQIKELIEEYLKEEKREIKSLEPLDLERITTILDNADLINFLVEDVVHDPGSWGGKDYWTLCTYHSEKLDKRVIIDENYPIYFKSVDEMADTIIETQSEIEKLEENIN